MDNKKIILIVIAAVLVLAIACVLIGYFTTGSWPWESGINPDYDPNVPKPDIEDFTGESGGVDTGDGNYDAVIDLGDLFGGN